MIWFAVTLFVGFSLGFVLAALLSASATWDGSADEVHVSVGTPYGELVTPGGTPATAQTAAEWPHAPSA